MSTTMRLMRLLGGAALVATTGCAGARTEVVASTATVPVSLSRAVRDARGNVVGDDRREVVGTLDAEGTAWGLLYSGVKLTPEMDVSQAVNEEVQRLHGDAVVNLSVSTRQCGWNWAVFVNVLPFWPGCANVHVHGDVIRVRDAQHASPSAAAAMVVMATPVTVAKNAARAGRTKTSRHDARRIP
jgi:hypothetical protein